MKRIFPFLFALLLLPSLLSAREIVRLTRYDGQPISGVSASHMFRVELIKSSATKAVVEIDSELERYLRFERSSNGVVQVGLNIPRDEQRRLERNNDFWKNKTIKLTLYLPDFDYIHLEDMARLSTSDKFNGTAIEIKAEDMAKITGLDLDAETVNVKAENMATVELVLWAGKTTLKATDMAKINASGECREAYAESSDMAKVKADELRAERATLKAADMAKTSMYVSHYLYARSSDMGSVDYQGNPSQIDLKTPRRTIYNINQ